MRTLLVLAAAIFASLGAWPQTTQAIMDGGSPSVKFTAQSDEKMFTLVKRQDLPVHTLVFKVHGWTKGSFFDNGCDGELLISASRVRWHTDCSNGQPLDEPVSSVQNISQKSHSIEFTIAGRKKIFALAQLGDEGDFFIRGPEAALAFLALAFSDFAAADAEFDRLTASLQPPKPVVQTPPPAPPKPADATLSLTTDPPGVQVYLDDIFRGSTSSDGKLIIPGIVPGAHKLRLSIIGFKEVSQNLELASGERSLGVKMEKAGPKPLSQSEVEDALEKGVSKTRLISLVNEYGVDFAITTASEQSLRSKGADDSLLFAISKNKR